MTDVREAVARAMFDSDYTIPAAHDQDILDGWWVEFREPTRARLRQAEAAIAAHIDEIMWPSEAMQRAGFKALEEGKLHTEVWQAMLTAMRNDK